MTINILALPWAAVARPNSHGELESDPGFSHRAFSLHPSLKSLQSFVADRKAKNWMAPDGKKECSLQFRPATNPCYDGHIPLHTIAIEKGDLLLPLMNARPHGVMVHTEMAKRAWRDLLSKAQIEEQISFGSPAAALFSIQQMAFNSVKAIDVLNPRSLEPVRIEP